MVSTRVVVADFHLASNFQFSTSVGSSDAVIPATTGRIGTQYLTDHVRMGRLGVVFGGLMYLPHIAPNTVANTSGKPVNILNVVTSHFDYVLSFTDKTAVYQISTDGAVSLLATRSGLVLADQVSATQGVEITNGTIQLVNISTGVVGATIATLPSSVKACRVAGDTTTSTFYVMGENGTIYRYNLSGTLLASLSVTTSGDVALMSSNVLVVTAGYVYYGFGETVHAPGNFQGSFYKIQKDLSSLSKSLLDYFFNGSGAYTMANFVNAHETSPQLYAYGLMDETASSSSVGASATPRYNDELTIELSSTREGVESHQKHSLSVTRTGWGLRWDESWGG
jgi:hypothetical protein